MTAQPKRPNRAAQLLAVVYLLGFLAFIFYLGIKIIREPDWVAKRSGIIVLVAAAIPSVLLCVRYLRHAGSWWRSKSAKQ